MSRGKLGFALLIVVLISSCASPAPRENQWPEFRRGDAFGVTIARAAVEQMGAPYRYGGSDRDGFDCSGLVRYAYGRAGLHTPRTAAELYSQARPVPLHALEVGDLLFYSLSEDNGVDHVAIYIGDGQFVHAPSSGKTVTAESVDTPHYYDRLVSAGRIR